MILFKEVFAEYMQTNMAERGWKLKDMAKESTLSDSTVNSYLLQKVSNPSEANVLMIIRAFGHSPDMLQELRYEASLSSKTGEKKLLNAADDEERMKLFTSAVRTTVAQTLEEYRLQAATQQTELAKNTEELIETERQRFKARTEEVVRQCNEETARIKESCNDKIQMMERHCDQRIADMRAHMDDVVQEKRESEKSLSKQYNRSRAYLKSSVRNLCLAGGILMVTNIFFGAYAIFAYTVFDMNDPTRGLHRETHSIGPMMLFLAIVSIGIAGALVLSMLAKKRKADEEE